MGKQLLIAGGSGLIGSAIQELATKQGWEVTVLSRSPGEGHMVWDPAKEKIFLQAPRTFDAIINLAGTSIAGGRWTDERKKDIVQSRVQASRTLEKYLQEGMLSTSVYIGASAIGIYGDRGNERVDEQSPIHAKGDWMAETVVRWEEGHKRIEALGIKTIILRIGIVLSLNGGALPEMLKTGPIGVLGYFGSGDQYWPWIHIEDLAHLMLQAASDARMSGIYLAASPSPVTNKEMATAASLHYSPHRLVVPVPVFVLTLMLGEMKQMLLQSCNGHPARLIKEGFLFRYVKIEEAMVDLIRK
jgi:uncharacterized protein (TIGR01777 family)